MVKVKPTVQKQVTAQGDGNGVKCQLWSQISIECVTNVPCSARSGKEFARFTLRHWPYQIQSGNSKTERQCLNWEASLLNRMRFQAEATGEAALTWCWCWKCGNISTISPVGIDGMNTNKLHSVKLPTGLIVDIAGNAPATYRWLHC